MNQSPPNIYRQALVIVLVWSLGFLAVKHYLEISNPFVEDHRYENTTNSSPTPAKNTDTQKTDVSSNTGNTRKQSDSGIIDPQYYLQNEELRALLIKLNKPTNSSPGPILEKPADSKLTYSELLSSVPNLESAFKKLRPVSTEVELIRLLSIIDSIIAGWSLVDSAHAPEYKVISNLLVERWEMYPHLISASNCVYCGSHFYLITDLVTKLGANEKWRSRAIEIHPRYMQLVDTSSALSSETRIHYARQYARLQKAGDSRVAQYIAHILLDSKSYRDFAFWAKGGLNGSNSITAIKDFSALPRKYLLDIWEAGMRGGYVNSDLTIHLLATGHRPALRYVIWQLDGSAAYLQDHYFKYNKDKYHNALVQYSSLLYKNGARLSEYYSRHWQQIHWDVNSGKWQS